MKTVERTLSLPRRDSSRRVFRPCPAIGCFMRLLRWRRRFRLRFLIFHGSPKSVCQDRFGTHSPHRRRPRAASVLPCDKRTWHGNGYCWRRSRAVVFGDRRCPIAPVPPWVLACPASILPTRPGKAATFTASSAPRASCWFFFVQPTGDPSAKPSSWSCNRTWKSCTSAD